MHGHTALIKLLLEADAATGARCDIVVDPEQDEEGEGYELPNYTPLHLAAYYGHPEAIKTLLAGGSSWRDLEGSDSGAASLHLAAELEDSLALEALLEAGVPVESRDQWGATALHYAAGAGSQLNTLLLLKKGLQPDERDGEGQSPLLDAVLAGFYETAEILLNHGAHPDPVSTEGRTALAEAVLAEDTECAELLLKHGARRDCRDAEGKSLLEIAPPKMRKWLKNKGLS